MKKIPLQTLPIRKGWTALERAICAGKFQKVKELIKSEADLNQAKNKQGWSPLYCAVFYNRPDIVALLIKNGANAKQTSKNGCDPLSCAIQKGHLQCIESLITQSDALNQSIGKKEKWLPLQLAAYYNKPNIITFLIGKGVGVDRWSLEYAIQKGLLKCVEALVQKRTNIKQPVDRWLPLQLAVYYNQPKIITLLIDNGDEVNQTSGDWTALGHAIVNNVFESIQALIQKGAGVNQIAAQGGWLPLQLAADYNQPEIIKLLIDNSADVHQTSLDGWTALECAIAKNAFESVQVLVEKGANVHQSANEDGLNSLQLVDDHTDPRIKSLLMEQDAKTEVSNTGEPSNDSSKIKVLSAYQPLEKSAIAKRPLITTESEPGQPNKHIKISKNVALPAAINTASLLSSDAAAQKTTILPAMPVDANLLNNSYKGALPLPKRKRYIPRRVGNLDRNSLPTDSAHFSKLVKDDEKVTAKSLQNDSLDKSTPIDRLLVSAGYESNPITQSPQVTSSSMVTVSFKGEEQPIELPYEAFKEKFRGVEPLAVDEKKLKRYYCVYLAASYKEKQNTSWSNITVKIGEDFYHGTQLASTFKTKKLQDHFGKFFPNSQIKKPISINQGGQVSNLLMCTNQDITVMPNTLIHNLNALSTGIGPLSGTLQPHFSPLLESNLDTPLDLSKSGL